MKRGCITSGGSPVGQGGREENPDRGQTGLELCLEDDPPIRLEARYFEHVKEAFPACGHLRAAVADDAVVARVT